MVIDPSCEDPGAAPATHSGADVTQFLRDYAQDALLLAPDGAITGRHAIGEFYRGAFAGLPQADFKKVRPVAGLVSWWPLRKLLGRLAGGAQVHFGDY